jgi:hydroxymethylpyrimidine pyrophosphatase-like HAD family hydrolase
MRFAALACDYDGTLAWEGTVAFNTLQALKRLKASGRRLILVTGRQLDDLIGIFPSYPVFDLIVAENGAILFWPATGRMRELAKAPPGAFLDRLQQFKVDFVTGRVVVATWKSHEEEVRRAIDEAKLELDLSFNKGAVMVLPRGCDKASGLAVAARELHIPRCGK